MTERTPNPSPRLEVIPATQEQAPVLANLLELYIHDFSEFHDVELDEDGRFGYQHAADIEVVNELSETRDAGVLLETETGGKHFETHARADMGELCAIEIEA